MTPYRLSFTAGGLMVSELAGIAPILARNDDDRDRTRIQLKEDRSLQQRTTRSNARLAQEALDRLLELSAVERNLLLEGSNDDRTHLAWLALCRRYEFIGNFARSVIRERYATLQMTVEAEDLDRYERSEAAWHVEIDALAPSTRQKLRSNLSKMAREAGILNANFIQHQLPSARLLEALGDRCEESLELFPLTDAEIKDYSRA